MQLNTFLITLSIFPASMHLAYFAGDVYNLVLVKDKSNKILGLTKSQKIRIYKYYDKIYFKAVILLLVLSLM